MEYKCYICKQVKTIDDFYSNKANKSGISSCCKLCDKKQSSRRYVLYQGKYQDRYYFNNKKKILLKRQQYMSGWRKKVLDYLGGSCVKCGYSENYNALQIDHIEAGRGRVDRARLIDFYKRVLEDEGKEYQLLCANCNAIKRIENREHGYGSREKVIYG